MRLAIAWFAREDWEELRRLCVDADKLHERYDDWLRDAEDLKRKLEAQGDTLEWMRVHPAELAHWCATRGIPANASARSSLAAELLRRKYEGPSS